MRVEAAPGGRFAEALPGAQTSSKATRMLTTSMVGSEYAKP
jgi:hypothetical protein